MVSPTEYRARKLQEKNRRKLNIVQGQSHVEQFGGPHVLAPGWKFQGFHRKVEEEVVEVEESPVSLDAVEAAQVSFRVLKKCLRCKFLNKYSAIECSRCHGRLIFDKTGVDVPEFHRKEMKKDGS